MVGRTLLDAGQHLFYGVHCLYALQITAGNFPINDAALSYMSLKLWAMCKPLVYDARYLRTVIFFFFFLLFPNFWANNNELVSSGNTQQNLRTSFRGCLGQRCDCTNITVLVVHASLERLGITIALYRSAPAHCQHSDTVVLESCCCWGDGSLLVLRFILQVPLCLCGLHLFCFLSFRICYERWTVNCLYVYLHERAELCMRFQMLFLIAFQWL